MNLLIDQREQSNVQEPDWTPESAEPPASPFTGEPAIQKNAETPLDYYNFEEPEGHRRGILGPILIILILLAAIGAAAYYGFFYKPQELGEFQKSAQQSATQRAEPAPVVVEQIPTESAVTAAPATESVANSQAPATTTPLETSPEPARTSSGSVQPPSETAGTASPLARAAALLKGLLAAQPAGLHVSTLILDQNSFSAEVSADNRGIIEGYAAALKSSVPGGLTSTPSSGYYSGTRALVSGSFPAINPTTPPVQDEQGLAQIKLGLRTAAQEAGLKVIELSQSKEIVREGSAWTPVFVKVSGSEGAFEQYCQDLAAKLPQMRLDKIILQKDKAERAVGVLRLEAKMR